METHSPFSEMDNSRVAPNNNMSLAIIGTILGLCSPCCIGLVLGIIAIIKSNQVYKLFSGGDYNGAQAAANSAKTFAFIAIALGILGIIINIVAIFSMGGIENYQHEIEEILKNIEQQQ